MDDSDFAAPAPNSLSGNVSGTMRCRYCGTIVPLTNKPGGADYHFYDRDIFRPGPYCIRGPRS